MSDNWQYSICDDLLVKDHGKVVETNIWPMASTRDSKNVFMGDEDGKLQQWSVDGEKVVKDYGKITDGYIQSMWTTTDNKYVLTSSDDKRVKIFSIK